MTLLSSSTKSPSSRVLVSIFSSRQDPRRAGTLLRLMDSHLQHITWGRRNFDHYNVPLHWMQRVAQVAADEGASDLLEDACAALFRHEPRLDRWRQKLRSKEWIASLEGDAAMRVARMLREHPGAARFYGPIKHAANPAIRAVLAASGDDASNG